MAGGGAGGNDFFLQFGSDAEPFSRQLAADLDPGIAKINALREALLAYDETAGKIKGGSSPLGITFDGLDQAASRLEAASKSFSGQMEAQVNALGDKITLLSETLSTVLRNVRAVPPGGGSRPGVGGPPREEGGRNTRRLTELDPQTQARLNALERAKRTGNNVGTVTPAEKAAADKTRLVNQESADSANKAADANSLNAKQVKATARALESLTGKLQTLIDTAKQMPKAGGKSASPAAASADAALQIANTTANPVPVIVVGGEAQAAVGHPPAHQTHMPHATTATSTAKAQAEVAAAAELVNAPNSFKNPARVLPGDRVAAGQYFLLPGQEKPTRAFGIRKGETVGEYSARVDAMRARELAALAGGPKLSEEDQQTLSRWREANGPLPKPRIRVEPISSPLTGSSRTHSTVSMDTVSAAEPYPKEISNLLRRRDLFASERQSLAHGYALSELRLDPMMTQDGLSGETKSALSQIDQAILAMNTKRRLEMLFEGEDHPDLETLKKGAKNRQKLREEGRAAAEEGRLTANAEAAIVGKAGTRDPITGEWYYGEGMVGVNERRDTQFASNMQLGRVAEERRDRVESGAERENDIANAGAHYRNAQAMAERLAAVRPTDIANVFEDQSGERVSLSKLRDQLSAFIAPYIQGELTPGIRRAQQGVRRNNPSSIERYEQQLRELTAQRALLTVSPKGSVEDQLASLRQVAQNYANL
ncbi:MAG TPA: hypothetical protein VFH56_02655, partial [Acidimicrobiales bacterium]|nr:hypothetical protein [Acidimicrobiales bacterium]